MIWSINSVILLTALAALQIDTVIGATRPKRWKTVNTEVDSSIERKINEFSFKLFKEIETTNNLVFSPLSVWMTLSMALAGSSGITRSELMAGLHLDRNSLINEADKIRKLIQRLDIAPKIPAINNKHKLVPGVELRLANKMFVKEGLEVEGNSRDTIDYIYNSLPANLNFTKSEEARKTINNWVAQETNGQITNFVDPNMIDRNAAMIFISTLYFRADWMHQFSEDLTESSDFYLEDGTSVKVPMMYTRGEFKYGVARNQNITFVELPYQNKVGNDAVSMIIIIPHKISDLKSAERNLQNLWSNHLRKANIYFVDVFLPKFKIESSINLQSPLEKLNMRSLFNNDAGFSAFTKEPMNVSSIIQKVVIDVNEGGTGATRSDGRSVLVRPLAEKAVANKPFLFLIATKNVILFSGKIVDPRQQISMIGHIKTAEKTAMVKKDKLGQSIAEKINDFSFELVKEIENKKNLIVSPLSVWTTLSMALIGSNGTTQSELLAGLHLDSLRKDAYNIRKFISELNTTQTISSRNSRNQNSFSKFRQLVDGVVLRLVNKMFVKKGLVVKKNSEMVLNGVHNSLPTSVDFTKSEEASKTINDWVAQQTNGRMTNFIDASKIDPDAAMIFVNTLYFKGRWMHQFFESQTKLKDFNLEDGTRVKVPMMYTRGEFNSGKVESQHIQFIEFPYQRKEGDDAVSMFVIIPDNISDLKSAEGNLRNFWLSDLRKSNETQDCRVLLPKFRIESSINLQSPLEKLQMRSLFNSDADFSGFADEPITVKSITQKVIIEVDEEGPEGTDFNEMDSVTESAECFANVNKPFLFFICTKEVILFSGRIVDPRQ